MTDNRPYATDLRQSAGKTPLNRFLMTLLPLWKCRSAVHLQLHYGNHVQRILTHIWHSPLDTYAKTLRAWRTLVALQDEGVSMQSVSVTCTIRLFLPDWEKTLGARYRLCRITGMSEIGGIVKLWNDVTLTVRNISKSPDFLSGIPPIYHCGSFWTLRGSPSLLSHPATYLYSPII